GKRIGKPITDLQVAVMPAEVLGGQIHAGYELARGKIIVALGRITGETMKLIKGQAALASWTHHVDSGAQGRQRHAHIRRVYSDAVFAGAKNRMNAGHSADRAATGAWVPLIARRSEVVEV